MDARTVLDRHVAERGLLLLRMLLALDDRVEAEEAACLWGTPGPGTPEPPRTRQGAALKVLSPRDLAPARKRAG